ncbi:hypothetical protein M378DRAFT_424475 [Amanita muscaria Koide BX008]|uniref:Uncharacterized protein n=1 Tax=Amanita muscaria (strain Koide BX008) TaxID=946122 RepID=A0A0C2TGL2_AMAMK|nr:hypothetical protein M378DRAFT_424475 [Amanita muscaria Koide BX008]
MANKPRVLPTALHSELTEYSSLLRTLRTNNILDVSLHITQSGRDGNILVSDEEEIPSQDPTWQEQVTDAVANGNGTNRKREREQHSQKRDNWTRWPLLLKDVFKPTWNFEDEVAIVASQGLKLNSTSLPSSQEDDPQTCPAERTEYANNDAEDDDLGVDDPEVPSYYKYIAMSTYDFLLNTLALIASHPPPRPPSMQNRIEPLDWRSVLEIVSAYGDYSVVDEHSHGNLVWASRQVIISRVREWRELCCISLKEKERGRATVGRCHVTSVREFIRAPTPKLH